MSVDSKAKYLTESLNQQMAGFYKRRKDNKTKAFWFKMLVTSFSALTTILLGLQGLENVPLVNGPMLAKNTALVLSALVTLLSVWDAFFNHRALWIRYTNTVTQLTSVKSEMEYLASNDSTSLSEEDVDRLFEKYQSILEDTNAFWQSLRDENAVKNKS